MKSKNTYSVKSVVFEVIFSSIFSPISKLSFEEKPFAVVSIKTIKTFKFY